MPSNRSAAEWKRLIKRWRQGDASAAEFAAAEGVNPSSLKWWAWKLGLGKRTQRAREPQALQLVPVQVVAAPVVQELETAVEIVAGNRVVRVRRGFDRDTLAAVLDVVGDDGSC